MIWRTWWSLIRRFPLVYAAATILRVIIFAAGFQVIGLIQRSFFDSLSQEAAFGWGPWSWAALLVAANLASRSLIFLDVLCQVTWVWSVRALMSRNMLARILELPGAQALPDSTGEAVSRFRGDTEELGVFTDWALFPVSLLFFSVTALITMLGINARITFWVFLPLVLVVAGANLAQARIQKYRESSRGAAGSVTGFIGELFGGVQAVKMATAEERMLARFRTLNEARAASALRDRLFTEILTAIFRNTTNVGTGVILLLAGQSLADGSFTVGDFSLFVYYLGFVTDFTAQIGIFLARLQQARVALERLQRLMQGAPADQLVQAAPVYMRTTPPELVHPVKSAQDHLELLEAQGLVYHYPHSINGIFDVDLRLPRGSFTVITGRIGSGKSTLLRLLLGLLPLEGGQIMWNGKPVDRPDRFMVPPHTAYVSQAPLLFSEPLRDNILLGLPEEGVDLKDAVASAILDRDIAQLDQGLGTLVGSRGVRLSGGQMQRAAAARMFVRDAELLVMDDLSSALDVNTEAQLWERLFARRDATCLAVSHRRATLRRADQVIVLQDGRVADQGNWAELLERCQEFQLLWRKEDE